MSDALTEQQRIALGFRPRTLSGWWFWLRFWSPLAFALRPSRVRKRLWLAWKFRVWPWKIPSGALLLDFSPLTDAEIRRTKELANKYGWETDDE